MKTVYWTEKPGERMMRGRGEAYTSNPTDGKSPSADDQEVPYPTLPGRAFKALESRVQAIEERLNMYEEMGESLIAAPAIVKPKTFWPDDTNSGMFRYYGRRGSNSTKLSLPYHMKYAYGGHNLPHIYCHEKVAEALDEIFSKVLAEYGRDSITELGLDSFGGCINNRRMRGSVNRWSAHSWGAAVDIDPKNNMIYQREGEARFSKPEYRPYFQIIADTGAEAFGPLYGYDYMHFQFAKRVRK